MNNYSPDEMLLVVAFFVVLMLLGLGVLYIIYRTAKNIAKNVAIRNEYEMEEIQQNILPVLKERPNLVLHSGRFHIPRRDDSGLTLGIEIEFTPDSVITIARVYDHKNSLIDTVYSFEDLDELLNNLEPF